MRVGIFGGTFDPPHQGHLIAAQDAIIELALDKVVFIPARIPPHKTERRISAADVRLRMVHAAVGEDERFEVSDVELQRTGLSFTVDTLRELRANRPGDELFLLIGVDQVREFQTWREPAEISRHARIALLARAGIGEVSGSDIVQEKVAVTRVDISSTAVRQRVSAGQPIRYLVPPAVEKIIADERLYTGSLG